MARKRSMIVSHWVWYAALGIPTLLLTWGVRDEDSPPAKLSRMIGLTKWIQKFREDFAKPVTDDLIPAWEDMPNVPQDIPIPHTLVLDLEHTLVSSTWDRKYGWRHAKRPGVDRFLMELAQYYEIILYSPSLEGIAVPAMNSLDPHGCVMHQLHKDHTYNVNGVMVKDLKRLNRNMKRIIVLDDNPAEVQLNPENLIRVKPYTDPTDRDDRTLERITPFLVEIAREGIDDIPTLLRQYQGMDADEIADEQERRVKALREFQQERTRRGLGRFVRSDQFDLPPPENEPTRESSMLTSKQIAEAAGPPSGTANLDLDAGGMVGFLNRRAKEREEQQMRKMEKWNEIMMKKHQEKQAAAAAAEAAAN